MGQRYINMKEQREIENLAHELHEHEEKDRMMDKKYFAHKPMMSEAHKAAEELRMEGKGSEDPVYENSKKNK
jgi:hypothetical protein